MAKSIKLAYNFGVKYIYFFFIPLTLFAQIQSKTFAPGAVHSLQIHNFLGPIEVVASNKTRVTIKKYDFVPACHLTSKLVDGTILMRATKENKLFSWADVKSCRVEILLEVPANMVMYLKSKKGDLTVKGMKGEITFDIEVGNAKIDGKLENLTGVIQRGDVTVMGATGNISLKTFRGNIEVHYQKSPFAAELDLISKDGNILLFLPKDTKITGNWKAPRGKLINDFTLFKASLFNLHLEAEKGNLTIKKFTKE